MSKLTKNFQLMAILMFFQSQQILADSQPTYSVSNGKIIHASANVLLTKTEQAPVIDGDISDQVWLLAEPVGALHQIYPNGPQKVTLQSNIKVLYDQDNLYIMAQLYDDDIDSLSRNVMSKGQDIDQDDVFGIVLDPFNDKTNGYYFSTNANGFKEEGLISNNSRYLGNWDGIWQVATNVLNDHWTVEMAIPFKSLSFSTDNTHWGINFLREVKQPEQRYYWASHGNTPTAWAPEHAGTILGFQNISQGAGMDVKLSVSGIQEQYTSVNTKNNSNIEQSLDVVYKPNTAVTASFTLNTDFSATEVDEQQINLTRFSLFTPEKRDFFLQGADIFEFGDIASNARPFFSRTLGLSAAGMPLTIHYGAKLTGQLDNNRFGVLVVNQDADGMSKEKTTLAVARMSRQLNDAFTIGAITTLGSPDIANESMTMGVDWQYRNKDILDGDVIEVKGWLQNSVNEKANDRISDNAFQIGVYLPNEQINAKLAYTEIGEYFEPSLGFINRKNIKQIDGWVSLSNPIKFGPIDSLYHTLIFDQIALRDGETISKYLLVDLIETTTASQLYFKLSYQYMYENINEDFFLLNKIKIPKNHYRFKEWQIHTASDQSKALSYELQWSKGSYFHGDMYYKSIALNANANRFVNLSLEASKRVLSFPDEKLEVNTLSAKINVAFSPKLFWNNWFQFNNIDNEIGVYSRIVWQRSPLNSFNFVLNQRYIKNVVELDSYNGRTHYIKQHQDFIAKLSYMWRF